MPTSAESSADHTGSNRSDRIGKIRKLAGGVIRHTGALTAGSLAIADSFPAIKQALVESGWLAIPAPDAAALAGAFAGEFIANHLGPRSETRTAVQEFLFELQAAGVGAILAEEAVRQLLPNVDARPEVVFAAGASIADELIGALARRRENATAKTSRLLPTETDLIQTRITLAGIVLLFDGWIAFQLSRDGQAGTAALVASVGVTNFLEAVGSIPDPKTVMADFVRTEIKAMVHSVKTREMVGKPDLKKKWEFWHQIEEGLWKADKNRDQRVDMRELYDALKQALDGVTDSGERTRREVEVIRLWAVCRRAAAVWALPGAVLRGQSKGVARFWQESAWQAMSAGRASTAPTPDGTTRRTSPAKPKERERGSVSIEQRPYADVDEGVRSESQRPAPTASARDYSGRRPVSAPDATRETQADNAAAKKARRWAEQIGEFFPEDLDETEITREKLLEDIETELKTFLAQNPDATLGQLVRANEKFRTAMELIYNALSQEEQDAFAALFTSSSEGES